MIIQGGNEPVILEFDEDLTGVQEIEVELYSNKKTLKHWSKADITINENQLICPLTERETMAFTTCRAVLEAKWKDANGFNHFAKKLGVSIAQRADKTLME